MAERNRVRGPVMLEDRRMVDRHIGGALLEIAHRIGPGLHNPPDETVGIANGGGWIVDESRLNRPPLVVEAPALVGREGLDLELRYALLAVRQFVFRRAGVTLLGHGPLVFGPELLLELRAPLPHRIPPHGHDPVSYTHLRAHETRHDLVCR